MSRETSLKPLLNSKEFLHRFNQLKSKLIGFSVTTEQGEVIGAVKDLLIDNDQRLNLVVLRSEEQPPRQFLIRSKRIQRVYPRSHTLSVDFKLSDIPTLSDDSMSVNPEFSDAFGTIDIEQDDRVQSIHTQNSEEIDTTLEDQPTPAKAMAPDVVEEEIIRLLEERLQVNSRKRKVGEVIVRKEIETVMIQVPVRREKLIVEQVSPDHRQLAEIDLGQGDIDGVELASAAAGLDQSTTEVRPERNVTELGGSSNTIVGDFSSPQTVAWLFDAIARQRQHGCKHIRVELELDDQSHAELYQTWFDRCTHSKSEH